MHPVRPMSKSPRKNSPEAIFLAGVSHHKAELLEEKWLTARCDRDIKAMATLSTEIATLRGQASKYWPAYPHDTLFVSARAKTETRLAALPTTAYDPSGDLFADMMALPPPVTPKQAERNCAKIAAYIDTAE